MKWILIVIGGLAALVLLVALVGAMLPRNHSASRTLSVRRTPEEIWTLVSDPAWTRDASGQDIPVETVESRPPHRLVTRIADPKLPFGGTWTFDVARTSSGATLTITEDGFVTNPIFRFVSRFVMGHHATIDGYLKQVAKKFDETPALTGS
jgi:hypothetical protein